jgi:hypothetical protein
MKLSDAAKRMMTVIGISFIVLALAGFVAHFVYFSLFSPISFAIGAFLGCLCSALKVMMLDRAVSKAVKLSAAGAKGYIWGQALLRFVLTGAVVALAAISQYINFWGVAAGLITLQIAAISMKNYKGNSSNIIEEGSE